VLVKITNPLHGLYYTFEPVDSEFLRFTVRHGTLHWVVMAISYALVATGYLVLFELFVKTETNTAPLAALTALPAGLNILGHVSPSLLDVTHEPLGVAVFAVGVLFAYVYQFGAVRLAGSLSEPMIMLSGDGRVKDYGRGATKLFPRLSDRSTIGEPLDRALPGLANALGEEESFLEQEGEASPRYYRIVETDVGGGVAQGSRVVILSDITERERRERALWDRQEKVEALYAAVNRLLRARREEEVGDLAL
jgi:PAS domain-containing protein